jgi:Flp pilus assembly pilin Flp
MSFVTKFVNDESGAAASEYGLMAAGISVAIIAAVQGSAWDIDWFRGSGMDGNCPCR